MTYRQFEIIDWNASNAARAPSERGECAMFQSTDALELRQVNRR